MYIKRLFSVSNFKGISDGFHVNFGDITYIIGDNAKNKTTIGSLVLWILTGYSLYGSNREQIKKENSSECNTKASMEFIDNDGITHTVTRCKGLDNFILLDNARIKQDGLNQFYKDIYTFLCAYNPYYFRSMQLAEQRKLLLRILPTISSKDAFNMLNDLEQEILEKPVEDTITFCKNKRQELKQLEADLERIKGSKSAYTMLALEKEENPKQFAKNEELKRLEDEYEKLITDTDNIISLEELEKDIKRLNQKINDNIQNELQSLKEGQKKEEINLENINNIESTCPTCKQKIKNESMIRSLSITYKKNIERYMQKIEKLRLETKELMQKKELQTNKYNILKTPDMQSKSKIRDELKQKIDALRKEKGEIDIYNKEIEMKHYQIQNAKNNLEMLNKAHKETDEIIEKYKKQLEIVNRLNYLVIEKQMEQVRGYLNKVTIEFNKLNEDTGEIEDVYEIKYDGVLYEKLSKSYKLRADIEIATLINKVTKIEAPMFIDDVESITHINIDSNTQTILAIVVKYNELEVLYSYQDVLEKQKKSIERKISESNNLVELLAA